MSADPNDALQVARDWAAEHGQPQPDDRMLREFAAAVLMGAHEDLNRVAGRLHTTAKETGDKSHTATAAGVHLACYRLVEIADKYNNRGMRPNTADLSVPPTNQETPDA